MYGRFATGALTVPDSFTTLGLHTIVGTPLPVNPPERQS